MDLTDEQLRSIYAWIDAIPLSRPKRNIARDFGDGCMLAEVIAAYFPELVELHNYSPANSEKKEQIRELQETVEILELKIAKLEQHG